MIIAELYSDFIVVLDRHARWHALAALLVAATLGCTTEPLAAPSPQSPPPIEPLPPTVQRFGSIEVTTQTSGSPVDPDGYVVRTDGEWDYTASPTFIPINGRITLTFISAGLHSLTLKDVAPNCRGSDLSDRGIVVVADAVTRVLFEVVCENK